MLPILASAEEQGKKEPAPQKRMKLDHSFAKHCDNTVALVKQMDSHKLTSEDRENLLVEREINKRKNERTKWGKYYETKIRNEKNEGSPFRQRDSEIVRPKPARQTTVPRPMNLLTGEPERANRKAGDLEEYKARK